MNPATVFLPPPSENIIRQLFAGKLDDQPGIPVSEADAQWTEIVRSFFDMQRPVPGGSQLFDESLVNWCRYMCGYDLEEKEFAAAELLEVLYQQNRQLIYAKLREIGRLDQFLEQQTRSSHVPAYLQHGEPVPPHSENNEAVYTMAQGEPERKTEFLPDKLSGKSPAAQGRSVPW